MIDLLLKPMPPADALDYFRGRGLQEGFAWQDVWEEEHAKAFTVAKAMRRDVLYDIRAGLDKALAEGQTFQTFRDQLEPLLRSKGWWGRQAMTDPLDGQLKDVQLGSTRRLRTIFDTNLRSAFQAGRWQRIQATKEQLPLLRYVCVGGKAGDGRTRLQHREWHGTILPVDHPWWATHYPPCGFRCRCTVIQLNLRTIERRGWSVTEEPVRFPNRTYVNPRTGEASVIEEGIDPGFNFNIGQAWLDGATPRGGAGLPQVADVMGGGRPPITPRLGPSPMPTLDRPAAERAFFDRFELVKPAKVFRDAAGEPVPISPALFTTASGQALRLTAPRLRALPLAAEAIADPDEIRWIWAEGEEQLLLRRYIRRIKLAQGVVDVVVDMAPGGSGSWWSFRTSLDGQLSLDAFRTGVLAFRKPVVE
ncbi:MAG: hypothetical protein GC145_14415 [Caulobacter sp.]|nr:hypothetical protein [Caulobacter sp.]